MPSTTCVSFPGTNPTHPGHHCICGHRIDGTGDAALFAACRAHSGETHADLGIADDSIRKLVAASAQMTRWDGTKKPVDGAVEIRALTPRLSGDFLRFFDGDAFMDNRSWSGCDYLFYQFTGNDWDAAPRATLPGLDRIPEFRCDDDPSRVGAIVSFNVAAPHRGQDPRPPTSRRRL